MIDMAPDHPITRHVSVAYWKGGDQRIEAHLYDPRRIEKIVAWGGFAGIKHVTQYLQPGLDLITLDPKHSGTIIGPEAFEDEGGWIGHGSFAFEPCACARMSPQQPSHVSSAPASRQR